MGSMKNLFDATSSLTALGNTFNEKVQYKNMSENASGIIGNDPTK
jgi:hypothetical protein